MKDFKSQSIETKVKFPLICSFMLISCIYLKIAILAEFAFLLQQVVHRVSTLFEGHPDLISGFSAFLPPESRSEVDPGESPVSYLLHVPFIFSPGQHPIDEIERHFPSCSSFLRSRFVQ
jgi:hypothetical protein